jgi:uncharacterized membrane protein
MLESIIFTWGPIVFALSGLILALYIYTTKKNKAKVLVCPIGGHCDAVVNSKYSKFLGVPVELMGSLYYALVIIFYSINAFQPGFFGDEVLFFATSFSVVAFFFSVYLVFIQAFTLKNWCTWCLFSAGFTTFIAITAVFGASFDLLALLLEYKGLIIFFHALAAGIGIGATTVTDVLFFKFLKDLKISPGEKSVMDTMSHILWVALAVLILTGIGLYAPRSAELLESSKFLVKAVIVVIIAANGLVLNFIVSPRLTSLAFGKEAKSLTGPARLYRKLSFASGAVSIVSWYSVFILGSIRSIPVSFRVGLLVYVGLVSFAVLMSQLYDKLLIQKQSAEGQALKTEEL